MHKVVVIAAELSAPPSCKTSFRNLNCYLTSLYKATLVVECGESEKDLYYHWMRNNHIFDFIEQFVTYQENIEGFRIAPHPISSYCYIVNRIIPENLHIVLRNVAQYL